jgi:hypothetical protein
MRKKFCEELWRISAYWLAFWLGGLRKAMFLIPLDLEHTVDLEARARIARFSHPVLFRMGPVGKEHMKVLQ